MTPPVRIVFLGGLGEIGRNCFCLEVDGRIVVVDCGLMFPDADMPGVDLVLPDFTYLRANAERVDGIVLTHGHEDHVGGLAYLLRDVSAPIYGSALSLGFARKRLEEARVLDQTELIPVTDGETRRIGPVEAEFVPVTHSVPHAFAVAYRTPVGTILHTGDFKLDLTPVDGRRTDLARLGEIGRAGVRLLLSDSTNAERPGFTESEASVGPVIRDLLRDHPTKRFIVASFASHLHRVEQIAREALAAGRTIAFVGRSMTHNVSFARELGLLDLSAERVIDIDEAPRYSPGNLCIICTGSQGEPMSALALMAAHEHKHVKVSEDDVVVISAHAIPGNESNVARVIDSLHRAGAEVVHGGASHVHVSGHASQEELKFMIDLVHPEWFVPVHGEYRHLVHHQRLAEAVGVASDRVLVCEDGDAVTVDAAGADVERRAVPAGYMYVDGLVGDVDQGVLRDRRTLAEEGFVVVIVTVDAASGELVRGPEIVTRGWVHAVEAEELLEEARAAVRAAVTEAAEEGAIDFETLRRKTRRALGRFINERTRRRPAIIPVVIEVEEIMPIRDWSNFIGGRTAVVTGSGAGVGRAIAMHMARAGAELWINDLDLGRAESVVAEIEAEGGKGHPVVADVCDPESVHEMARTTGPVDILVNNAGSGVRAFAERTASYTTFVESSPSEWEPVMRVNLTGVLHVTHAYLGDMIERGWGRILTIVSDAGRRGERRQVVYGAAKAAAMGFSRGLAAEVGRSGVTVNCISLGSLRHGPAAEVDPERERRMIGFYPVGRLGRVDDPAPLAVMLCSDAGEWITGQVYPVNGGYVSAL